MYLKTVLHIQNNYGKREKAMTNRQSIHIALLLWGSIFCILAFFCMHISREIQREKKKYMLLILFSGAVLLASDAAAWGFRGRPGNVTRSLVYISNFLVFLFSDILLLLYHGYICSWIFGKNQAEKRKNRRVNMVYAICTLAILLVCVSQFTHLYYYIDGANYYHRNPAYSISLLLPMLGMLLDLSLLIQYRKNFDREILASLISYIVLPFLGAIALFFYYGISWINIAVSISVILMFLETMIEQGKKVAIQERKLAAQEFQLAQQERILAQRERDLTESRIGSMLSQIRNHFIFNTLGVISGYCKIDPEKADEAIACFARYLRRNMHYLEEKGMIPFETEAAQIEDYVALEQMRFEDLIEFGEDFQVTDFQIPPLTVQPLVENAVKHGLTRPGRKGNVCLFTHREDGTVIIEVVDDGIGFSPEELEKDTSLGIRNIRYRLEHMADARLIIESAPGKGTRAVIRIPENCRKEKDDL